MKGNFDHVEMCVNVNANAAIIFSRNKRYFIYVMVLVPKKSSCSPSPIFSFLFMFEMQSRQMHCEALYSFSPNKGREETEKLNHTSAVVKGEI